MPPDQIVGTAAAAKILKVEQATVSKMCRDHKFPHAGQDKPGHPWHIPVKDIEEYQRNHRRYQIHRNAPD